MDLENSNWPPGAAGSVTEPPADESGGPPSPPSPHPSAPERRRRRFPIWGIVAIVMSVLLFGATAASIFIHVPYSTISPGEAVPLPDLVHVSGASSYPTPRGDIRLLFVRERNHISLLRYLLAKFDDNTDVFKEKEITGGQSNQQQEQEAQDEMTTAKLSATKVALEAAGYNVPAQIVVQSTDPALPAAKVLQKGDVLVSADGKPIKTADDLRAQVARHAVGDTMHIGIRRNGVEQVVPVGVGEDQGRKVIGVNIAPKFDFPFKVDVDTTGIGGPSGGLAMTLAILDDLTAGNLTGGRRVAVTGTIDDAGNVGPIGGIKQKAVAARDAGAQLFIVPKCQAEDPPDVRADCEKQLRRAIQAAGKKMKVVPVGTFTEALNVLRQEGGDAVVKSAPGSQSRNAA